uniref:VENN motif pre-toxin domain-containing protein n=1 Tax=Yersinia artesiana TaxID=2890315 RepID=UPI001C2E4E28
LAGGDMAKALAGASAPYLAEVIHNMTLDPTKEGGVNIEANLMAHAVLGAVTAYASGNSALAGAAGAASAELMAPTIIAAMGWDKNNLSEDQKQTVSALATLAAGLAGGLTGDSTADTVAGAQVGKNAVENNFLAVPAPVPPPVALPNTSVNGGGGNEAWDANDGSDPSKSREENARQPNVAKDLTDEDKAELGGAGSGTPGGWEPQDEENARNSEKQNITVEDLTSTSSKGNETTGRSKLFERTGGSNAANKEFDALSPTEIKDIPSGRIGKLPDGRTVIVRERSTDGRPTLEIQSGKNRIKFRYDE